MQFPASEFLRSGARGQLHVASAALTPAGYASPPASQRPFPERDRPWARHSGGAPGACLRAVPPGRQLQSKAKGGTGLGPAGTLTSLVPSLIGKQLVTCGLVIRCNKQRNKRENRPA
jgi:hypothetical protein